MDDKEYIKTLENALIFMCSWYRDIDKTFMEDFIRNKNPDCFTKFRIIMY